MIEDERLELIDIRGWVYVITNPSMSGLVKVGYSTRDPLLRALELGGTGSPTAYELKFDALVQNPRQLEAKVHKYLQSHRVGKEWFRCEIVDAVKAIQQVAENLIIAESFRDISVKKAAMYNAASPPGLMKSREVNGSLLYVCNSCKHETRQPIQPVARCGYCGRTAIWNG